MNVVVVWTRPGVAVRLPVGSRVDAPVDHVPDSRVTDGLVQDPPGLAAPDADIHRANDATAVPRGVPVRVVVAGRAWCEAPGK